MQKLLLRINESRKVPLQGLRDENYEESLNSVRLDYQVEPFDSDEQESGSELNEARGEEEHQKGATAEEG